MTKDAGLYHFLNRGPLSSSFRGKLKAVATAAILLPTVVTCVLVWLQVSVPLVTAGAVIAVAVSVVGCALAFDGLVQPLRHTSRAMAEFADRGELPDLPTAGGDVVADIMANAQRGMVMLDEVRRQRSVDRTTDPITGLINTRSAVRRLGADILRAERDDRPMSVALIEIDNLESLAQQFGHESVDSIAKTVSNVVVGAVRRSDWVANHASHQFLVGLWGVERDAASTALNRVAQSLRSNGKYPVSLSIGLVSVSAKDSPDRVIANASNALARARRSGGNRIEKEG